MLIHEPSRLYNNTLYGKVREERARGKGVDFKIHSGKLKPNHFMKIITKYYLSEESSEVSKVPLLNLVALQRDLFIVIIHQWVICLFYILIPKLYVHSNRLRDETATST